MPVEVGHDREVAAVGDRAQQRRQRAARGRLAPPSRIGIVGVDLDRAVGEDRRAFGQRSVAGLVEQLAGVVLGLLDVGLVERVDAEHPAGDRGRVLPDHELRTERAARPWCRRCAGAGRASPDAGRRASPKPGASTDSTTTGSRPVPCLPVDSAISCSAQSPKPWMPDPKSAMTTLSRPARPASPSAAPSVRAGLSSSLPRRRQQRLRRRSSKPADVDSGEGARHQPEGGQRAVAAADVRVGQEDPIAGRRARLVPAASRDR